MISGISDLLKDLKRMPHGAPQTGGQGRRVLQKGMSGMDVARCQNLLNRELAYSPPPLWVDGIFGPITDRKVREFQMKKQLKVDGIVGPATWSALEGRPVAVGGGGAYDKAYTGGGIGTLGKALGGVAGQLGPNANAIAQGIGKALGGALDGAGKILK